ncbi:MAG TPA: hypothetical protein VN664_06875 [Burkholderiales bacterium]|jgi:hypothetical protein|nr:hypothetical protein [Burkholderiales bacterium]
MPASEDQLNPILSRAERNAYRLLLKNDLDPFEFDVAIHAGRVFDGKVTYVLEISTLDHAISVRETGIPLEFIERSRPSGGDAFARIVDQLVPGLIENMKSSGHIPEAMAR